MAAYTHYWTNRTYREAISAGEADLPLNHVASNIFLSRGVREGDSIYVVTVLDGALFLIGRLIADKIVHSDGEAEAILGYTPWSASDHLIAEEGHCTAMNFQRSIPFEVVRQLRFEGPDGISPLRFRSEWALDQQTLRGVRKLTNASAILLDSILYAKEHRNKKLADASGISDSSGKRSV